MAAVVDSTDGRTPSTSRALPARGAAHLLPRRLVVLSGLTGAGKTDLLAALSRRGEQVLDLEALACHSGSAFGALGRPPQPSHRAFQARIAAVWCAADASRPLFVEDEGEYLGSVGLPSPLVALMRSAERVLLETPRPARLQRVLREYGAHPAHRLLEAIRRASPRLGSDRAQAATAALARGDRAGTADVLLAYYDAAYAHRLAAAGPVRCTIQGMSIDPAGAAEQVANYFDQMAPWPAHSYELAP